MKKPAIIDHRKNARRHFLKRWKERVPDMEPMLDVLNNAIQKEDWRYIKFVCKDGNSKKFHVSLKGEIYTVVYDVRLKTAVTLF